MNSGNESDCHILARRFQAEFSKFGCSDAAGGGGNCFLYYRLEVQNELVVYLEAERYLPAQQQPVWRFLNDFLSTWSLAAFAGLLEGLSVS